MEDKSPNIKYCSEIQFLSCFIQHFVNPIETETGPEPETEMGLFTFGCTLFARFSVSTVGLEPSVRTTTLSVSGQLTMSLPTEINGFTKWQIKHDRNGISQQYLIWNINEHHQPLGELHIS